MTGDGRQMNAHLDTEVKELVLCGAVLGHQGADGCREVVQAAGGPALLRLPLPCHPPRHTQAHETHYQHHV